MYAPVESESHQSKIKRKHELKLTQYKSQKKELLAYQQSILDIEDFSEDNAPTIELIKTKVRAVGRENKKHQKTIPTGCQVQALFGLPTVEEDSKILIITEGEYDAMAVYQETGKPTVSLPQGASHLPK
jgi:hypothetical protein